MSAQRAPKRSSKPNHESAPTLASESPLVPALTSAAAGPALVRYLFVMAVTASLAILRDNTIWTLVATLIPTLAGMGTAWTLLKRVRAGGTLPRPMGVVLAYAAIAAMVTERIYVEATQAVSEIDAALHAGIALQLAALTLLVVGAVTRAGAPKPDPGSHNAKANANGDVAAVSLLFGSGALVLATGIPSFSDSLGWGASSTLDGLVFTLHAYAFPVFGVLTFLVSRARPERGLLLGWTLFAAAIIPATLTYLPSWTWLGGAGVPLVVAARAVLVVVLVGVARAVRGGAPAR